MQAFPRGHGTRCDVITELSQPKSEENHTNANQLLQFDLGRSEELEESPKGKISSSIGIVYLIVEVGAPPCGLVSFALGI